MVDWMCLGGTTKDWAGGCAGFFWSIEKFRGLYSFTSDPYSRVGFFETSD